MKQRYIMLPLFIVLIYLFLPNLVFCQTTTLPIRGWAKNSVNAVIFRKNSVVTHASVQYTAFYDGQGFVVLAKRKLGTTNWETKTTGLKGNTTDAHNTISIMVDGLGYLHISWDHHNNPLNYCRSVSPGSLDLSAKRTMIGNGETSVSYPEFHRLPQGDLIFMYRNGASGNGNLVMNRYYHLQNKWVRVHNSLIDGEGARNAYWQACVDEKGAIHLSWVWRESSDVASNHDLCYAKSSDGGTTWKKTTGATYRIPIVAGTAEYALKIPQKSELINQTSMYGDAAGNPYICSYWRPSGSGIPQYHVVYNNGKEWKAVQASNRKTAFTLSGSGTKKIPISRPQIVVENIEGVNSVYVLYRDVEQGDKVSLAYTGNLNTNKWSTINLTEYATGSWEPSFDTELWKARKLLHIYVQRVGQGDGEQLENLSPQDVTILEWSSCKLSTGAPSYCSLTNVESQDGSLSSFETSFRNYPNPFEDTFTILAYGKFLYSLYDQKGVLIESGTAADAIMLGRELLPGLYIVSINNGTKSLYRKVVKLP